MEKSSSQGAGMKEKKGRMMMPSLYFTIIAAILGLTIISPIMPAIATDLKASGIWMGMIFSGFAISRALLCLLWVDYQINMEERFSSYQGCCCLQ